MTRTTSLAFLLGTTLFAACAADPGTAKPTASDDPLADETNDGEKADGAGIDTFGIYTAQKVGAFECNGAGSCTHVSLTRANRSSTYCADGSYHASCDVRTLDFSKLGLTSAQLDDVTTKLQASAATPEIGPQLLVRGKYVHGTNPMYPNVDWVTFQVTELWTAAMPEGTVAGTFVMLSDNGKRCFEPPCAATTESRLNSTRHYDIDGVDWPDGFTSDTHPNPLAEDIIGRMYDQDGLIVVGTRTAGTIMHLPEQLRLVNQAYLLMK